MTKKDGFFGTDNLHRAGWGALLGLAGFLGALMYTKIFGPQRVVVEANQSAAETRQVTTEVSPQNGQIADLTQAIQQLSKAATGSADQKRLRELAMEVDRLRAEVAQAKRPSIAPSQSNLAASAGSNVTATASLSVASEPVRFHLPDTVGGYTSKKIFGVSDITCPPTVISSGADLVASFNLNDKNLIAQASPLRATVVRVRTPTDLLQIAEVWNNLQAGANVISLRLLLQPGTYKLSYGFYLRDQLSGEFPPFYSRVCTFDVKPT